MFCNIIKVEKYVFLNCNFSISFMIYGFIFFGYDDCICYIFNDKINVFFILICFGYFNVFYWYCMEFRYM